MIWRARVALTLSNIQSTLYGRDRINPLEQVAPLFGNASKMRTFSLIIRSTDPVLLGTFCYHGLMLHIQRVVKISQYEILKTRQENFELYMQSSCVPFAA